ncbi:lysophospholipid acyltransferase family protein [Actinokineospora sp.]|uniref:lysophospholipid acyltransferase family protein n=1 Tax=Actinokineospora sp. TaxID=1872133 RepID=UPI0040377112
MTGLVSHRFSAHHSAGFRHPHQPNRRSAFGGHRMTGRELVRRTLAGAVRMVFRPRITGLSNIPTAGPFILAANHLSFADHTFLMIFVPRPVFFVGKAERFGRPGLRGRLSGKFFERMDVIPVRRDGGRGGVAALELSRDVLDRGYAVGIHPEGTRSPDGRLYRGHTGAAWMSLTTGAPVVPCGLVATDRVQPPGRFLLRPVRFDIHFGTPIEPTEFAGREKLSTSRRQLTDQIMREIRNLSGQEFVDRFAIKGQAMTAAARPTDQRGPVT